MKITIRWLRTTENFFKLRTHSVFEKEDMCIFCMKLWATTPVIPQTSLFELNMFARIPGFHRSEVVPQNNVRLKAKPHLFCLHGWKLLGSALIMNSKRNATMNMKLMKMSAKEDKTQPLECHSTMLFQSTSDLDRLFLSTFSKVFLYILNILLWFLTRTVLWH